MDFWVYLFGGVCAGTLGVSYYNHHKKNKIDRKYRQILKARTYSPSQLSDAVENKETYIVNLFKTLSKNEIGGSVFIEGLAGSKQPLKSVIDQKSKLITSIYIQEDVFSNDRLHKKKKSLKEQFKKAQANYLSHFTLKDLETSESFNIDIKDLIITEQLANELIAKKEENFPLNSLEKIIVGFLMVLDFFFNLEGDPRKGIRGLKIGISEKEFGIKVDSILSVFGEVIYNYKDKTLRVVNPLYLVKNKADLVKYFKEIIDELTLNRNVWGIIGIGFLFITGYCFWQNKKKKRNNN